MKFNFEGAANWRRDSESCTLLILDIDIYGCAFVAFLDVPISGMVYQKKN